MNLVKEKEAEKNKEKAERRFVTVTETPGIGASKEQLSMLYTRYKFALPFCKGKKVLEVACGSGQGLGYLAGRSVRVVGGDIDSDNLRFAGSHYSGNPRVDIQKFDAHRLPFKDSSFGVIIIYEAIYYLNDLEGFLLECRRVLHAEGTIVICTVNNQWPDFNPSPFSTRYYSGAEISGILENKGFQTTLFAGFPVGGDSIRSRVISVIKRMAVSMNLVPKTMKGKEFLKRVFFGELGVLPDEVREGMADYRQPLSLSPNDEIREYKVLYIIGRLP
ncbi:MAG TPA: class I SAM-dependent methyltransferase [Nitrospiria bacterium]|nr:class I SAM-dependent methyltransferase [Nitrospiria bacterium]